MKPQLFFLLAILSPAIVAKQVANLNISSADAAQYGCENTCYETFSAGLAEDNEVIGGLYDEDFYATAANFSGSVPGDILKVQRIDPQKFSDKIPEGTTAYRFQYTSLGTSPHETVPVSGFIAFPKSDRTGGTLFRTVAWAHGTSGVWKGCAPSAMPDLYEYGSWSHLIRRGYAVIATDYAGLGTSSSGHAYSRLSTHANDVFYSVVAARKLFGGSLTSEWISVGHSQGGGTVWTLAEENLLHEDGPSTAGKYLGTVAQAPGVFQGQMAQIAINATQPGRKSRDTTSQVEPSAGVLAELGWAIEGYRNIAGDQQFSWLESPYLKRLELAKRAQACYESMRVVAADLDISQILNLTNEDVQAQVLETLGSIDDLTSVGERKANQPILILQGLADLEVLPEMVEHGYNKTCETGTEVHLQLYPDVSHDDVIPTAAPFFLQWMDDRFDGIPTKGGCTKQTSGGYDNNPYMPDYD